MKINTAWKSMLTTTALLVGTHATLATTPRLLNHQGLLTDVGGSPVPDSTYAIAFRIYDVASGGSPIWSETRSVATDAGRFSIVLGSVTPIPDTAVLDTGRYLAIQIGSDPELAPRQQLTSVPYAINGGGWVDDGSSIRTASDSASIHVGPLSPVPGSSARAVRIHNPDGASAVALSDGGAYGVLWEIQSTEQDTTGTLNFSNMTDLTSPMTLTRSGDLGLGTLSPASSAGGRVIDLTNPAGPAAISLRNRLTSTSDWEIQADNVNVSTPALRFGCEPAAAEPLVLTTLSGDSSAMFEADAVNSIEMLNEPGIASDGMSAPDTLDLTQAYSTDLARVTINTPAAGYIVVDGYAYLQYYGPGSLTAWLQISETSGLAQSSNGVWANTLDYSNGPGGFAYVTTPVKSIVYKSSAGPATFYLQGNAWSGNSGSTTITASPPTRLQATYYPTSYGTVAALVSSSEAEPFENVNKVTVSAGPDGVDPPATLHQVDLRELELRAARASAEAERLNRELAEAKLKELRIQADQIVSDKP